MKTFLSLLTLRLKQTIGGEGPGGLMKFLSPNILVGVFLGVSSFSAERFAVQRAAIVATAVGLFTLIVESRKLFYSSGDVERFYFVQPNLLYRLTSVSAVLIVGLLVTSSVGVPFLLFSSLSRFPGWIGIKDLLEGWIVACAAYLILISLLSLLPGKVVNLALTVLQIFFALSLVAMFQLSAGLTSDLHTFAGVELPIAVLALISAFVLIVPVPERITDSLRRESSTGRYDLMNFGEWYKRLTVVRGNEEEAGFVFFLSNLFRNSSFRLSTIAVAATPIMVAIYWSIRSARFVLAAPGYTKAEMVAPLASLVVSGIIVHYFLSQNLLASRDTDASWFIRTASPFNTGRFVMGVRKALILTLQLPVTLLIFFALILKDSLAGSLLAALSFCSLTQFSVSWFSIMQRRLPFSQPFARVGRVETVNVIFLFAYSAIVTVALFFCYSRIEYVLAMNLLAFIFIGIMEFSSVSIVNKRINAAA